jgi:arylformamidase
MTSNLPNDPRQNWAALSQAERDAAYDNNKAVANSPALIAARNEASAKFRASHATALDIPYGKRERTKIDLYPARDKAAPCLVFIHGGYWQRNSRDVFAMLVEGVAAHGWSVAIPGYSLAPEASLSEIVGEISLALDWPRTAPRMESPAPSSCPDGRRARSSRQWRSIIPSWPRALRFPASMTSRRSATPR